MTERLKQVANHLTGSSNGGLLNGEVVIITGELRPSLRWITR